MKILQKSQIQEADRQTILMEPVSLYRVDGKVRKSLF